MNGNFSILQKHVKLTQYIDHQELVS